MILFLFSLLRYDLVARDVVMYLVTLLRIAQLSLLCMVIIVISSYEQEHKLTGTDA